MSWRSQFSCFLGRCLHIFPKTTLRFGTWNCASWRALRENLGLDPLPAMPPARLPASPARWCSSLGETHNPMGSLLLSRAAGSTVLWLDQDSWECCCPHASYVGNYAGDFKHLQLPLWLTVIGSKRILWIHLRAVPISIDINRNPSINWKHWMYFCSAVSYSRFVFTRRRTIVEWGLCDIFVCLFVFCK